MKNKAMRIYRDFARAGRYAEAKHVLRLLRQGWIGLQLGEEETAVEMALDDAGFAFGAYSRDGGYCRVYLRPARR